MKRQKIVLCILVLLIACGLLRYAPQIALGVGGALQNCAMLLIPSLFPFMVLAAFAASTEAGVQLSRWVAAVLHPITGLPHTIGASFFMSFLGGFPVGAQMLSRQLQRGEIDRETAEKALCCSVNAGPSFLIGTIGALFHPKAGILLLVAQICSSLCIAAALFYRKRTTTTITACVTQPDALVASVRSAASGMFGICAFVTAFSACSALLQACGLLELLANTLAVLLPVQSTAAYSALLVGLLEVTNGCIAAAALPNGLPLTAFLVSFSSLSILFQVKSCFETSISFRPLYLSRIFHGALTCFFFSLLQRLFPNILQTASLSGSPVFSAEPNTFVSAACLLAMCTLLFLPSVNAAKRR